MVNKTVRLGIDLDGTMCDFVGTLRSYITQKTGRSPLEMAEPDNWNFYKNQWGYTSPQYVEFMKAGVKDGEIFWEQPIEPFAKMVMDDLYAAGYELYIVTARLFEGVEEDCVNATKEWLGKYDIPHHKLIVSNDKTNLGLDLLLDDAPHNIENAELHGTKGLIYDQLWNRNLDGDRVYGWISFRQYIKQKYKR